MLDSPPLRVTLACASKVEVGKIKMSKTSFEFLGVIFKLTGLADGIFVYTSHKMVPNV